MLFQDVISSGIILIVNPYSLAKIVLKRIICHKMSCIQGKKKFFLKKMFCLLSTYMWYMYNLAN